MRAEPITTKPLAEQYFPRVEKINTNKDYLPDLDYCDEEHERLDREMAFADKAESYMTTMESYLDFMEQQSPVALDSNTVSLYNLAIENLNDKLGISTSKEAISLEAFNGKLDKTSTVTLALEEQANSFAGWLKRFWDWIINLVQGVAQIEPILLNSTSKLREAYSELLVKASRINTHDPRVSSLDKKKYLTWNCFTDSVGQYFYGCTSIYKGIENLGWFCEKVGGEAADLQYKITEKYIDQTSNFFKATAQKVIRKKKVIGGVQDVNEAYRSMSKSERADLVPFLNSFRNLVTEAWKPTFTASAKHGFVVKIGLGTAFKTFWGLTFGTLGGITGAVTGGLLNALAFHAGLMAYDYPYKTRVMAALTKLGSFDQEQHAVNSRNAVERALTTTGYELAAIPRWRKDAIPNDMTFAVLKITPGKAFGAREVTEDLFNLVRMERRFFSVSKVLGLKQKDELKQQNILYCPDKINPSEALNNNIRTAMRILDQWYPNSLDHLARSSKVCAKKLMDVRMSIGSRLRNTKDERAIFAAVRSQVAKLYLPMKQFHMYLLKTFKVSFKALYRVWQTLDIAQQGKEPPTSLDVHTEDGTEEDESNSFI